MGLLSRQLYMQPGAQGRGLGWRSAFGSHSTEMACMAGRLDGVTKGVGKGERT